MIRDLFKVPIWIEDDLVDRFELEKLEWICETFSKNIPDYHHEYNPDTYKISRNSEINILDLPEFEPISNLIREKAIQMMLDMGYSEEQTKRLKNDNAWFCMYRVGDSVQMHVHRPSFISAAFYIKNDTSCKLRFIQDLYKMSPYPKEPDNQWSRNSVDMDCPPGRLLLFPSDCAHGTDQIKGDVQTEEVCKVMLSYNFILQNN